MNLFSKRYNQCPLDIKTFDGSNSPYHPSVLYFKDGWQGHKYWMAQTPFSPKCKPYRDRYECPQIHFSDDGINWTASTGKPIDDLTEAEVANLDYFSDPCLVFNGKEMECWYRLTRRHGTVHNTEDVSLYRKRSTDGINWGERVPLAEHLNNADHPIGNMIVSPTIKYADGIYHIWYVDSESMAQRNVAYSSFDGKEWSAKLICSLEGFKCMPWHIDIMHDGDLFIMTVYDFKDITLWTSKDGNSFKFLKTALEQGLCRGSFYYDLYKACLINDGKYRLYFSANDLGSTYIGLMEGDDITELKVVNTKSHGFRTMWCSWIEEIIPRAIHSIKFRITHK